MLTSYISDETLKRYHPQLEKQLWAGKVSYGLQIDEAFAMVQTDVVNKGINPRLLMQPFYLTPSTGSYVSAIASATGDTSAKFDFNLKRFVVEISAINTSHTFSLEGSNDESTWTSIGSITVEATGTHSLEFTQSYKYWRYLFTLGTGTGATFRVSLVETLWDKLIIYKAFVLIFSDFRKDERDHYDLLVNFYDRSYQNLLDSAKFLYNEDDSSTIDDTEVADSGYHLYL